MGLASEEGKMSGVMCQNMCPHIPCEEAPKCEHIKEYLEKNGGL